MLNTVLIAVHAVAATVAFGAGVLSLPSGRFLVVYRGAMALMLAALVPAVLVDWGTTDPTARLVFLGLLALGAVVVLRTELAVRQRPSTTGGPTASYLEHLGFTLIALADGFAVVAAIRGGAPGWVVGVVAVGVVVVGHLALHLTKRQMVHRAATDPVVAC